MDTATRLQTENLSAFINSVRAMALGLTISSILLMFLFLIFGIRPIVWTIDGICLLYKMLAF